MTVGDLEGRVALSKLALESQFETLLEILRSNNSYKIDCSAVTRRSNCVPRICISLILSIIYDGKNILDAP